MSRTCKPVVLIRRRALWDRLGELNRSQSWLAREVGISPSYLSRLLRAGTAPSGRVRQRLQQVLGFGSFHDLFALEHGDEQG